MSDFDIDADADARYSQVHSALSGLSTDPEFGPALTEAGVFKAWNAVAAAKLKVQTSDRETVTNIRRILDDPNPQLSQADQLQIIRNNNDVFKSLDASAAVDLESSLAAFESTLMAAQQADFTTDPVERPYIERELDALVEARTRPTSDGQGGRPFRPGDSMLAALMAIAASNPGRYAASVMGSYGATKMITAGEQRFTSDLVKNVLLIAPRTSAKSQAAHAAMEVVQKSKVRGVTAALSFASRQRVEAANRPTASDPASRFDTMRLKA